MKTGTAGLFRLWADTKDTMDTKEKPLSVPCDQPATLAAGFAGRWSHGGAHESDSPAFFVSSVTFVSFVSFVSFVLMRPPKQL
jgi:hypothetical protein